MMHLPFSGLTWILGSQCSRIFEQTTLISPLCECSLSCQITRRPAWHGLLGNRVPECQSCIYLTFLQGLDQACLPSISRCELQFLNEEKGVGKTSPGESCYVSVQYVVSKSPERERLKQSSISTLNLIQVSWVQSPEEIRKLLYKKLYWPLPKERNYKEKWR